MTPAGWTEISLGEICHVGAGNSAPQGGEYFANGTYPFFRTSDVGKVHFGLISESSDLLNEHGKAGLKLYKKGTILFPKSGASTFLNHRVMMNVDGFVVSHLATITANEDVIDNKYLLYYLSTIDSRSLIQDASYPSINLPIISSISVKYPADMSTQQRIVEKLDALFVDIDRARQIAEKNLQNSKELFESELNKLFVENTGWEHKKLSEVAIDFGRGKSKHRPRNDKCLYDGQYPFIQTGDIRNSNHYITSYTQTYNETGVAQSKLWPKGTLCITIAANIAETGILDFDACFPDSVIGGTFDSSKTNVCFVEYLLQSFKTVLQAKGKGSAQDNINLGTFENQFFPFPEKSVQDSIVQRLDALREQTQELERLYAQQLADLDELKQSILKKAFNGEL